MKGETGGQDMLFWLLLIASGGDREKFELLYEKYKRLLLKKAYEILGDYQLAEDAVSEAYIRVYRNLHKVEEPVSGRSAAFLVTITRNVALSMASTRNKYQSEPYDEAMEDDVQLEQDVLSELASEEVVALLDGIGEEFKSVFLLKYAYDLSHKDIGKMLGISENNVTVRLHRARKKLSALLRKGGYADERA